MIKFISFFAFLLATTSFVSSGNIADVNQLQYVTSWVPAYCKFPSKPTDVCKPNLPDIFVTHGIWPADVDGETVSKCSGNSIPRFILDKNKDVLSKRWPAIMLDRPDFVFWAHEYLEHGRCSSLGPLHYVGYVISVSTQFNITAMLSAQGIIKSNQKKYSKSAIQNAIGQKIGTGYNIYLSCKEVNSNLYYLREMAICMDNMKSGEQLNVFRFISCPPQPDSSKRNNCGGDKPEEENIMLLTTGEDIFY